MVLGAHLRIVIGRELGVNVASTWVDGDGDGRANLLAVGRLAQLVEHRLHTAGVAGSSPVSPTNEFLRSTDQPRVRTPRGFLLPEPDLRSTSMAGARFDLVTVDCVDTAGLARYWTAAVNLVELQTEDDGRWIVLGELDANGSAVRRMGLQRIEKPVNERGRFHLDLECSLDEFDDEIERLLALGASLVRPVRRETYGLIANMNDPEGNLFDVCAYVDQATS